MIAGNLQTDIQGILESQTGDKMNLWDYLFDDEELLGDEPVDKLIKQMKDADAASKMLSNTVGVMLVSSFDDLGVAIGQSLAGADDALKGLAKTIGQNLGNILIMAGVRAGFNVPLILAGIGIQLVGGIIRGLGSNVPDMQHTQGGGTVDFRISGNNLVGVLERNYSRKNSLT